MTGLLRHIEAVRNVTLPGNYVPFRLGADQVGWVTQAAAHVLASHGCRWDSAVVLDRPDRLGALVRLLSDQGCFSFRGEAFDVRATPDGPVLASIDRGALPWFGILAQGVHVNGLVQRADGLHLWVGRRATDRMMDPGKLDHLVAGGIPAGLTREQTLVKEGAEEAGLDELAMRAARYAGVVGYTMARPEGLRRDLLHCYDLLLPDPVQPKPSDGEVSGFELWPIDRVIATVRETDDFKFNVSLVLIDLFLRLSLLSTNEEAVLSPGPTPWLGCAGAGHCRRCVHRRQCSDATRPELLQAGRQSGVVRGLAGRDAARPGNGIGNAVHADRDGARSARAAAIVELEVTLEGAAGRRLRLARHVDHLAGQLGDRQRVGRRANGSVGNSALRFAGEFALAAQGIRERSHNVALSGSTGGSSGQDSGSCGNG